MRALIVTAALAGTLFTSHGASAGPLLNGDFESTPDFTGWDGDAIFSGPVDPNTDPHFTIVGGAAELSNDFDDWSVTLFQTFDLPSNAISISFDYAWQVTDITQDVTDAVLRDVANNLHDLFPTGFAFSTDSQSGSVTSDDISALAGQTVTIEFTLQDGDFFEADSFSIDNIVINTAQVPLPLPPTLALLALGLLGLVRRQG